MTDISARGFQTPGRGRGLMDVFKNRFLLKLLVDKEIQVRYRGSVLGIVWSYIKPGVQFLVFYLALGVFLGLNKGLENYAVYLFSGIILINFFGEAFGNGARCFVGNGALIKKIYLPRELFSVSTIWVGLIHFVPQLLVLLIACFAVGWHPGPKQIGAALAGIVLISVFSYGLGLIFGVANVFFRDSENIVDLLVMMLTWLSPIMYSWTMVQEKASAWLLHLYMVNPITISVELFHYAFWSATLHGPDPASWYVYPHLLSVWTPVAFVIAFAFVFLGDLLFRKFEGNFAQEL
ncbi:sugar ABC transporter permease [Rothia kristinae]|uniref:Transport permease protein n=1 Tax=Rothia kristinae TaxID=37923 RepID=A0A1S2N2U8_9MICC|nr:ABC transporter permease [Rothia kristinae]OIJ36452.1 sugar ABC transporter permease [Rothia kristinae]